MMARDRLHPEDRLFTIVGLHTVVHAVADIEAADRFYLEVLGGQQMFRRSHGSAKGWASRHSIADITMEPIASADADSNIHRVCERYGERLYSTAWLVDDVRNCYQHLTDLGIRTHDAEGASAAEAPATDAIFTHPRDTYGTLEFALAARHLSEQEPEDSPQVMADGTGIMGLAHISCLVRDLEGAEHIYVDGLGGIVTRRQRTNASENALIRLSSGQHVELVAPISSDSAVSDALVRRGEGPYGVTFSVRSREQMAQHLRACGLQVDDHDSVLVTRQEECHGVEFRFVEQNTG